MTGVVMVRNVLLVFLCLVSGSLALYCVDYVRFATIAGRDEMIFALASSPSGTWSVAFHKGWSQGQVRVWIEAFDADGSLIGKKEVSLLEEWSVVEQLYGKVACSESEVVFQMPKYDWSESPLIAQRKLIPKCAFESSGSEGQKQP